MFDLLYTDGTRETFRFRTSSPQALLEKLDEVARFQFSYEFGTVQRFLETAELGDMLEDLGGFWIFRTSDKEVVL